MQTPALRRLFAERYSSKGKQVMKAKMITSSLLGLMLPWSYFLIVTVSPIRSFDQSGNKTVGAGGLAGFVEFNGLGGSLFIYAKAVVFCALVVFIICEIYEAIAKICATKS